MDTSHLTQVTLQIDYNNATPFLTKYEADKFVKKYEELNPGCQFHAVYIKDGWIVEQTK